jgi:hypothetical protein
MNQRAFLKGLPISKMSGHEKFLAVAFYALNGKLNQAIELSLLLKNWPKSLLLVKYSPIYFLRSQEKGWLNPSGRGKCELTDIGIAHIQSLSMGAKGIQTKFVETVGALSILQKNGTFSADQLLNGKFLIANNEILVADSYVSRNTLGVILNGTKTEVKIKIIFGSDTDNFIETAKRYRLEYQKLEFKHYKHLHDRFFVIDGKGFVLGPSIKDTAANHPALLVELGSKESILLSKFFWKLWKIGN